MSSEDSVGTSKTADLKEMAGKMLVWSFERSPRLMAMPHPAGYDQPTHLTLVRIPTPRSMSEFSETSWLNQLKAGNLEAATPIWTAYFCRLIRFARQKLNGSPQRVADAEDVALSAFHSFCTGVFEDRFQKLHDRNDLWQVLAMITTRKAIRQVERERALKRGGGIVRGESVFLNADGSFIAAGISQVVAEGPTPELQVAAIEQFDRLLDLLDEPLLKQVALLRLEGHSNEDIAHQIGRNVRTVERKLNLIRSLWSQETGDDNS